MKRYLRIIKNSLGSIFSIGSLCCIVIIFIYVFVVKSNTISDVHSFSEVINKIFRGPTNFSDNLIEVFTWGLYQFFLIYMIGNFWFKELDTRSIYTLPRLGNKQNWHICLQITSFLACIIFFVVGTSIIFICTSTVNINFNLNEIGGILKIIVLLSLSSYYLITVYIFSILISRKHNQSFLVLITTLFLSIELGDILKIDKYLPFNQGILSKHIISNFSYQWSFIYLFLLILVNLIFINKIIVKRDLFKIVH